MQMHYSDKAMAKCTKICVIHLDHLEKAEQTMLATLQGLLANQSEEMLFLASDATEFALKDLEEQDEISVSYQEDPYAILNHFLPFVKGYLLYSGWTETNDDHSINVATTLCNLYQGIAIESSLASKADAAGLPMLFDCRGKDEEWLYDQYWDKLNHRFVMEIRPDVAYHQRDYAVMSNSLTFFVNGDSPFREKVLQSLPDDSMLVGWSASPNGELGFISQTSRNSVLTCPSDWSSNLSTLSSFEVGPLHQPPIDDIEFEDGCHYVTILMSDGDNEQWFVNHGYGGPKWYNSPYKGKFHMSYAIPPTIYDKAPTILRGVYQDAAKGEFQDRLVAGPSGAGYMYPSMYTRPALESQCKRLNEYMALTDTKVVAIIDEQSFDDVSLWDCYTAQPNIEGLLYLEYSLHSRRKGEVKFSNGKPVFSCTHLLWKGLEEEDQVVADINTRPRDKNDVNSYSCLYVHAWSKTMENVNDVVERLDPHVKVVTPEQFVRLLSKNLAKNQ